MRRQVRDLELKVWGRRRRRNHGEFPERSSNTEDNQREPSHQKGSRQSRERLWEFTERLSISLE